MFYGIFQHKFKFSKKKIQFENIPFQNFYKRSKKIDINFPKLKIMSIHPKNIRSGYFCTYFRSKQRLMRKS